MSSNAHGFVEVTRRRLGLESSASQQSVSENETAFHILEASTNLCRLHLCSSCFCYRDFGHRRLRRASPVRNQALVCQLQPLCATGERRQNFNLYGLAELLLKIFLMGHASVDQYGTELNDPVEARIRSPLTDEPKGVGNRLSLKCFLGDACCGPCASPVMKGNGHHCVTLKHAFRPYRGGLKASTGINSLKPVVASFGMR